VQLGGGGVPGKFVVHAEMAAARQALQAHGGDLSVLRGAIVYIARLATKGEHFEDGAPCRRCDAALRACGLARAVYTTAAGRVETLEFGEDGEGGSGGGGGDDVLREEAAVWMGVPRGWARVKRVVRS
jgi:hypothetical protein